MKPLIDLHERRIKYIRVSVTDRCNFKCRYCMPEDGVQWMSHDQIIRYEELLRILSVFAKRGVEKIRITGGEPLLRKGIVSFIEKINSLDGIKELTLTTNGIKLASLARELKEAGLKRVNVSLDTLDKKKFAFITRVDAYDEVINGIFAAHKIGLQPVKLNTVAIKGFNDEEIPEFAKLTLGLPIEVRFIELMPIGCISRYPDHEPMSASEIKTKIENVYGAIEKLESGLGPASIYKIPGAQGRIGIIGSLSELDFCSTCNRVRITATGHLRPCLFSDYFIDLLTPIRNGISDEDLEGLIEEGVRRKPSSHGMCRGLDLINKEGPKSKMSYIGG